MTPSMVVLIAATLPGTSIVADDAQAAPAVAAAEPAKPAMKIHITVNDRVLTATLEDAPAARDFIAQLPLTLTLEDYAATEKIAYLPSKLNVPAGDKAGLTPVPGDIAYYAPWGNLAIFYRGARHAEGLVKLGHLDEGVESFRAGNPLQATISKE